MGRNPRKTGEKVEVWKLKLDDGSELIATPNHKILLKSLEYKELKDLKEGDSIFPFYSFESNRYRQISFSGNKTTISVEFFGFEDVYNITVDDNHNYHVLTKVEDDKGIVSSGICVKNCGEIPLSANDSCRLISVNLSNFIENEFTDKSSFDFEKFKSVVSTAMRLSDDLIDLELEKLDKIYNTVDDESEKIIWKRMIDSATNGRRTGLGTHGLADALTKLQLSYGSPDSLTFIDKLYSTFKNTAYDTSVELSNERGSFPAYDKKIDYCEFFDDLESDVIERMKKYGRRNISILTNAPTGSVSILSQTSSGIEPVFRNFYERRRKLTTDDKVEADFTDANGDKFQQYKVYHHNVKRFIEKHGETLPSYFVESQDLDWKKRVAVQSIIQKHIDHSISSTINLPKGTTSDTVEQIYMTGWEEGLKGITVYVDGSRDGVLITEKKDKFLEREYTKRPDVLDCDIHHKIVDGERYIVMIGLLDGRPYEVFAGKEEKIQIPRKYEKGKIIKREYKTRPNEYDLSIDDGLVKDIVTTFNNPDNSSLGRMISLSLRYGSKIPHVVEQLLQTSEDSSMTCFSKVLARVLKQYIPDGTKAEKGVCPECHQNSLIYKEGCVQCSQCAWSKCS
jgi:ribonucleoside-diphosphate reductase alpha chain